jgi:hypothetical protein
MRTKRKYFPFLAIIVLTVNISANANDYDGPGMDFVMCSAYARIISGLLYSSGKKESSILMLSRSEQFAGFAIRIGELEGFKGALTLKSIDTVTGSLKKKLKTDEERVPIVSEYEKMCPDLLKIGVHLRDKLWPGGPQ